MEAADGVVDAGRTSARNALQHQRVTTPAVLPEHRAVARVDVEGAAFGLHDDLEQLGVGRRRRVDVRSRSENVPVIISVDHRLPTSMLGRLVCDEPTLARLVHHLGLVTFPHVLVTVGWRGPVMISG